MDFKRKRREAINQHTDTLKQNTHMAYASTCQEQRQHIRPMSKLIMEIINSSPETCGD